MSFPRFGIGRRLADEAVQSVITVSFGFILVEKLSNIHCEEKYFTHAPFARNVKKILMEFKLLDKERAEWYNVLHKYERIKSYDDICICSLYILFYGLGLFLALQVFFSWYEGYAQRILNG